MSIDTDQKLINAGNTRITELHSESIMNNIMEKADTENLAIPIYRDIHYIKGISMTLSQIYFDVILTTLRYCTRMRRGADVSATPIRTQMEMSSNSRDFF